LRPTRYSLSGVHDGWLSRRKVSFETCFASDPSRFMYQRLSPPLRSEVKAIHLPFGE
jgi:hypothetical protein